MGILDFFRKPKDNSREWHNGKLIINDASYMEFKYFLMSRDDISRISVLENVLMGQNQKMIMTTTDLEMNQASVIELDDCFQYSFISQYTEKSDTENNIFGIKGIAQKRYITLRRLDS